jgi:hypothetical protein
MARGRRARHVASPRLVPHANRLGLAWPSQAETALAEIDCAWNARLTVQPFAKVAEWMLSRVNNEPDISGKIKWR